MSQSTGLFHTNHYYGIQSFGHDSSVAQKLKTKPSGFQTFFCSALLLSIEQLSPPPPPPNPAPQRQRSHSYGFKTPLHNNSYHTAILKEQK